jgi:two-component system, OmpR family, phosphate regulon sensor histidine kinase PhoR
VASAIVSAATPPANSFPHPRLRADQRLFVSYLVFLTAMVAVLVVGIGWTLERHLTASVTDGLRRELELGREVRARAPGLAPESLAVVLGRASGRRVTVVSASGTALGDSDPGAQSRNLSDYRVRPEVRDAMERGEGTSVRVSGTVGVAHVYVAARMEDGSILRYGLRLSEVRVTVRRVRARILGAGALALATMSLISLAYSRAITRPLRRLGDAARAMAAGDLNRRVRVTTGDELGELADALNSLASELERRIGQLEAERFEMRALIDSMAEGVLAISADGTVRRANPAVRRIFALRDDPLGVPIEAVARRPEFLRLVERGLSGEAVPPTELSYGGRNLLATAHALPGGGAVMVLLDISELRRLEGVRRDFVANASHELKTPLTAIRGYSETLLDESLPPELALRFAGVIRSNAERLQRLVDDLLDLSRIESGGWQIRPETVDLEGVAREAWYGCAEPDRLARVGFQLEVPDDAAFLWADPSAVRQILDNLFSNALRYTPEGGEISLRATPVRGAQGWARIDVTDTGTGIPASHLPRVFERFYRVDASRAREQGGTGLGLAIVKHLVESHGGQAGAESRLGEGTTLWFTLRLAAPEVVD